MPSPVVSPLLATSAASHATTAEWVTATAACVAAVFGGGSLIIAFRILLRDRGRAIAAQAGQVACWRHWPATTALTGPIADRQQDDSGTTTLTINEEHLGTVSVETDQVHVHNASDRPITDVGVRSRKMSKPELRKAFSKERLARFETPYEDAADGFGNGTLKPSEPAYAGVLMPGETAVRDMVSRKPAAQYYRRWVTFRDVNGIGWLRDLSDGQLLKAGSLRATLRLRRGWWRQTWRGPGRNTYHWWVDG